LTYRLIEYINFTIVIIPKKGNNNQYNSYFKNDIKEEYSNLVNCTDNDSEHEKYLYKGNSKLDRYSDIKPYNHNRIEINSKNKYINASPINIINQKYFILTQGPKKETIEDFWTMVDENECKVIVMLCNKKEDGRKKCEKYWAKKIEMKNYIISVSRKNKNDDFKIREIKLINLSSKIEKTIIQIHFIDWPDHGVPDNQYGKIFETFIKMIELVDKYKGNHPAVIHCSAGVGRSGTFTSMYYLKKEIEDQIKDSKAKEVKFSIFNLVRKIKEMRLYSVQSYFQYQFIYEFANYLLNKYF